MWVSRIDSEPLRSQTFCDKVFDTGSRHREHEDVVQKFWSVRHPTERSRQHVQACRLGRGSPRERELLLRGRRLRRCDTTRQGEHVVEFTGEANRLRVLDGDDGWITPHVYMLRRMLLRIEQRLWRPPIKGRHVITTPVTLFDYSLVAQQFFCTYHIYHHTKYSNIMISRWDTYISRSMIASWGRWCE